jgi:hypothetical protein
MARGVGPKLANCSVQSGGVVMVGGVGKRGAKLDL